MQQSLIALIKNKWINSAHDISEGGLFTTLLESSFSRELGFMVFKKKSKIRKDAYWFGEAQSRVVVSVSEHKSEDFESQLNNVTFEKLGRVTSGDIIIDNENWGNIIEWKHKYDTSIESYLKKGTPENGIE